MNHITVSELIDKLKVADGCARVVLDFDDGKERTSIFDVLCISPVSEVIIGFLGSGRYAELEADYKALEKTNDELEKENDRLENGLGELQNKHDILLDSLQEAIQQA